MLGTSQLPVTLTPGDQTPASRLGEGLHSQTHKHTSRHRDTHNQKQNKSLRTYSDSQCHGVEVVSVEILRPQEHQAGHRDAPAIAPLFLPAEAAGQQSSSLKGVCGPRASGKTG